MVSASALEKWDGDTASSGAFDFSCFVGDLQCYSRTNPGLAWRAVDLARFMQPPGPMHVAAAWHVLRCILGHLDAGLTYHGGASILTQFYDNRNKLVAAFDADFKHDGGLAISSAVFLMNGAAVAWKVKRQTTISNTTSEAEVKACG